MDGEQKKFDQSEQWRFWINRQIMFKGKGGLSYLKQISIYVSLFYDFLAKK